MSLTSPFFPCIACPLKRTDGSSVKQKIFVRKIIAAVEKLNCKSIFESISHKLELYHITFSIVDKETMDQWKVFGGNVDTFQNSPHTLWIVDSSWMAERMSKQRIPFVVFFHANNKTEDFSMARFGVESPDEIDIEYYDNIYRRFAGIPWDILETSRCLIRETTELDVEAFYNIYKDPSITRYMENLYPEIEEEKQYIRKYIEKVYSFYDFGIWTVVLKETGEVIGRAGFSYREGYAEPEIGYIIGAPWQRQGIAYEICTAILKYGEKTLGFETVQSLIESKHTISLALSNKLGFEGNQKIIMNDKEYIRLLKFIK